MIHFFDETVILRVFMGKNIFCLDFVKYGFTLLSALPLRKDLRYCLDLTLLARNKKALVNEFKWAKIIVIPKMSCNHPFPSSVNVVCILSRTMLQTK